MILYAAVFFILLLLMSTIFRPATQSQERPYTYADLISDINERKITQLEIRQNEGTDSGQVTALHSDGNANVIQIPGLTAFMQFVNSQSQNGELNVVTLSPSRASFWWQIALMVIIAGISVFLLMLMIQQMQGGGGNRIMSFGKSRARSIVDDKHKITFDQVAGLVEEKAELEEIVEFLKNPKKFTDIGARIPKGVLLVGPPGTGKTYLAKAVSGEAGVPFFSISGSDFVEMFVGVGASRVRDLFENAKKNTPCIVFIDEIDAVGRRRGAGLGGGHDEREQTLNQLLVEMDGFGVNDGVIIMAATNRPDILDPALLRPGRFDRRIVVGKPDVKGRESVLKIHAKGKQIADNVDMKVVAQTTSGFTPADLENLLNEAALLAARHDKKMIDMDDLRKAFVKVGIGTEKKSRIISDKERRVTAYHEAGHAILFEMLSEIDPTYMISVIPTGMAGGYTMPLPGEEREYITRKYMEQTITSLLGGRAAEHLVIKDITTGASNDIERATSIARNMVMKYGMSDALGPVQFGDDNEEVFIGRDLAHTRNYGENVASLIDSEVKRIVEQSYKEALHIIEEHITVLHQIAELLLEKEKVTGEEIRKLFPIGSRKEIAGDGLLS
ncbi:MAG: ATP-dependent zinc metalloprotease FtsH [Clostridiales bacterium]|jgi:cell division protease FtsH|nr:ATP-dependent zinc metalloprotease FtsH [Clostridiales bacterium]